MTKDEEIDTLQKGLTIWRKLAKKRDNALKEIMEIIEPVDSQFVTKDTANEEIIRMIGIVLLSNGYKKEAKNV